MPKGVPKAGFRRTLKNQDKSKVAAKKPGRKSTKPPANLIEFIEPKQQFTEFKSSLENTRKFDMTYNGEKVNFNDYFQIVVSSTVNNFIFRIPCRGSGLQRAINFQNSMKWSTYVVEKISEKEYTDLSL